MDIKYMNAIQSNDPELENFLLILAEHPDAKDNLYPRILNKLPWGYHPSLYIETIKNPQTRLLIRDSISKDLISKKIRDDLRVLLENHSEKDFLIKGAFLLSFFSSDLNYSYEEFYSILENISSPLNERMSLLHDPSELTRIKIFLEYVFDELKFTGDTEHSEHINNHYIHNVIEKKKGGSIILCIIANALAKMSSLELPVIITAGHFLLKSNNENSIPYIDPYRGGKIISEREHMADIALKGYDPSVGLIHITSPLTLYQRLIRNLLQAAQNSIDKEMYSELKEFHETVRAFIKNN